MKLDDARMAAGMAIHLDDLLLDGDGASALTRNVEAEEPHMQQGAAPNVFYATERNVIVTSTNNPAAETQV